MASARVAVPIDVKLTSQDRLLLDNLLASESDDTAVIDDLDAFNDPLSSTFDPQLFTSFDASHFDRLPKWAKSHILEPYKAWAITVVRHPTDVVFVSHILIYLFTLWPSALLLFWHFTPIHALVHAIWTIYCAGPFVLILHNHAHQGGLLSERFALIDRLVLYFLGPLMGQPFDAYAHHHLKMHHVEGNGPDDLSFTLPYQRDSAYDLFCYVVRFFFFIVPELGLWFVKKGQYVNALNFWMGELSTHFLVYLAAQINRPAALVVGVLPYVVLRLGMPIGNWGQHAFVDEEDPLSDLKSSITLVDTNSNRHCFNDGYHTSHHLNPRRHWRDHQAAVIRSKSKYAQGNALFLRNIDFLEVAFRCVTKDFDYLAKRVIPIGDQTSMTHDELVVMLKGKMRRLTRDELQGLRNKLRKAV